VVAVVIAALIVMEAFLPHKEVSSEDGKTVLDYCVVHLLVVLLCWRLAGGKAGGMVAGGMPEILCYL